MFLKGNKSDAERDLIALLNNHSGLLSLLHFLDELYEIETSEFSSLAARSVFDTSLREAALARHGRREMVRFIRDKIMEVKMGANNGK